MNTQIGNSTDSNNKSVMGHMLLSVLLYSILPVAFVLGNANNAPLLFSGIVFLFSGACGIVYLFVRHYLFADNLNKRNEEVCRINIETYQLIKKNLWDPNIAWILVSKFTYLIFAFALGFVDASIATILIDLWPIFMVIFMAWLFKDDETSKHNKKGRYEPITAGDWLLFAVAFFGVAFVVASQNETFGSLTKLLNYTALGGVALLLIAAALSGLIAPISMNWARGVMKQSGEENIDKETFFTIVSHTIGDIVGGIVFLGIGVLWGETTRSIGEIGITISIIFGFFGLGIGGIAFRIANIKTTSLSINALGYAIPVVGLIWLAIANSIHVPHIDWLIIGVAAIITANLLLNVTVDVRSAYKALIIALWFCGTVIYLHKGFVLSAYAENIGMIATVFILILAFRLDRLVRRTTDEERDEFLLFRRLSTLVEQELIDKDAPKQLRKIDKHTKPTDLRRAYEKLHEYFVAARVKCTGDKRVMLDELQARADTVAHSKQQGDNFGELTTLGFLGFIMIGALLLFKPDDLSGWEGVFVETSAFLLAATIIFLFFSIFDLQHDRANAIFKKFIHPPPPPHQIPFGCVR